MTDFMKDGDLAFLFRNKEEFLSFVRFCCEVGGLDRDTFLSILLYWDEIEIKELIYYKGMVMTTDEYKEWAPVVAWKTWLEEYENELRNCSG